MAILEVQGLEKVYTTRLGSNSVKALSNVTFSVEQGNTWQLWANLVPEKPRS